MPEAVGTSSLLCLLASSKKQHEQQLGWKDYRDMKTRLYMGSFFLPEKWEEAWNPSVLYVGEKKVLLVKD